jgi:hypothetical protein
MTPLARFRYRPADCTGPRWCVTLAIVRLALILVIVT